jgi:UDP-glucose:(heptosyl)LPS alpha-1,3-glucosyltransferase
MKLALSYPGCHKRAGVERIMLETANYLARRGHDLTVYAAEFEYDSLDARIHTQLIPLPKSRFAAPIGLFARAVKEKLRSQQFDLHCTFGVVCPDGGVEWVQSVHKAWLEISQTTRDLGGRITQMCNPIHPMLLRQEHHRMAGRNYRKLVALTPDVSSDLQRLYRVPVSDIEVLPNGFSSNDFNLENAHKYREVLRQQLGYSATDKVVIFVANELERKGFYSLTQAISMLEDQDIKLLVAGKVNGENEKRYLSDLSLYSRTKFVGPSAEVYKYYAAADLFALPTKYEAWGMVIVEAMACGLPVVTSRLAGASVAVKEGINGLLLDNPSDPAEVAQKLRHALYSFRPQPEVVADSVSEFSWDNILAKYEAILLAQGAKSAVSAAHGHSMSTL